MRSKSKPKSDKKAMDVHPEGRLGEQQGQRLTVNAEEQMRQRFDVNAVQQVSCHRRKKLWGLATYTSIQVTSP